MALQRRKTRMYEPWGYRDQNYYESDVTGNSSDFSKFFAKTEYVKDDNKIYFYNEHGTTKGVLDVNEFMKDDKIIEKAYYDHDSQSIIIKFTNGDTITVPVEDLLDINEFKDGLTVDSGTTPSGKDISVVKVLKDQTSERWLTVSIDGVKVSGIQAEIDRLDARIDKEIEDRIADVDEEEARAKSEEHRIEEKLNAEIARSIRKDETHDDQLDVLDQRIDLLESQLPQEVTERKERAFADAEYDANAKEIVFKNALGVKIGSIDATPFLNDGMVERTYIDHDTEELVIVWNTQSGQQETRIPLTEIFNPNDYYTKDEIDGIVDRITSSITEVEDSINEEASRATSAETALQTAIDAEETRAISAETSLSNGITALSQAINGEADRAINAENDLIGVIDDEAQRAISAETELANAIELKADADVVYTQEEVNALLLEKENEIYNLTKIVGDIGGAVTYNLPNEAGKSFNTIMNNNGTVKLTDDVTTGRFGPGITAKNNVKLNLNNHNLNVTGLTASSAQGAIMSRGTQEITIYGKGTIDSGGGICIEANGADSVINLTGSTTVYQNDRSGGELIYCYAGTINITNGTFKNLGDDKAYMLNCYDANYRAGTAKIIVTGGKFYDFNPADNSAEGEHTSFVPEGYHVETSTDGDSTVYTVKKDS